MARSLTQLYDLKGRRKYLTHQERVAFLNVTKDLPLEKRVFCQTLLFTGCRISEALKLTTERIDPQQQVLVLQTLKRRDTRHQRAVPVPACLIKDLQTFVRSNQGKIWAFSRRTGWRIVKASMKQANVTGIHACPKGLRHAFGISCAENNVPISLISTWLGHSNIETTTIYMDAVGKEERRFAKRTWLH